MDKISDSSYPNIDGGLFITTIILLLIPCLNLVTVVGIVALVTINYIWKFIYWASTKVKI